MSLKAKIEAIIYAAEEPITLENVTALVKDMVVAEEGAEKARAEAAAEEQLSPEQAPQEVSAEPPASPEVTDSVAPAAEDVAPETPEQAAAAKKKADKAEEQRLKGKVRAIIEELISDYDTQDRGMEIRMVANGYRMATKPEHHDVVRAFAKSLKPPVRLSLAALETLAVIAYKQPITVPEISEIRGVESAGVIGTLLDRKLITTAGRKQVIGRPILYKTTKDFLVRFGLANVSELPSMEEFEKLASDGQVELFESEQQTTEVVPEPATEAAATGIPEAELAGGESSSEQPEATEAKDEAAQTQQ